MIQRAVIGDGARCGLVVTVGWGGAFAARPADAFEGQIDATLGWGGTAGDDGPVGLFDVAGSECRCEFCRGTWHAGEQQHARGVAVQPMDQARTVSRAEAEGVEERVQVVRDAGSALHGQAVRLVSTSTWSSRNMTRRWRSRAVSGSMSGGGSAWAGCRGQRRHAYRLAGSEPRRCFGAMAIHAHLAGAAELLDRGLGHAREVSAEPAVEADICLVFGDHACRDCHGRQNARVRGTAECTAGLPVS